MHKTILFILLSWLINTGLTAQAEYYREHKAGSHFIFGDKVRMRKTPSIDSPILFTLPILTSIQVIEKTNSKLKIEHVEDFWYKVKYKNKEGYIWGPLISDQFLEGDFDADGVKEMLLVSNLTIDPNLVSNYEDIVKFRIARNHKMICEYIEKSWWGITINRIETAHWMDFKPTVQAIGVDYAFNGETGGYAELFLQFKSNQLTSLLTLYPEDGEGGYACYENGVFPHDKNGLANTIVIEKKCAQVSECDDDKNPCKWEYSTREFRWNGDNFIGIK